MDLSVIFFIILNKAAMNMCIQKKSIEKTEA